MDSLRRLRILRQVAIDGSLTAAANSLAMSQPSVSQQLAILERELGSRLVERSPRGVALTAAGEIALDHALMMINAADSAHRQLDLLRQGSDPVLRIAAFGTACEAIVPTALRILRSSYPHVRLALDELEADEAVESVRLGRVDVALAFDYAAHPLQPRSLHTTLVVNDPLVLVLPVAHPLAGCDRVSLSDLACSEWIGGTGFSCAETLRTVCGAAGFAPKIALQSNRYPTTLALVAEGHGIALVPLTALVHCPTNVVARQLAPSAPHRRIWTVTEPSPAPIVVDFCFAAAAALQIEGGSQRQQRTTTSEQPPGRDHNAARPGAMANSHRPQCRER